MADDSGTASRIIQIDPRDLGLEAGNNLGPRQRPFAAVPGCSDARVPIELIFNEGPNDLFVVRGARNDLGSEVLGSLKYAVEHMGGSLKIVVVLGHSGCGAVSSAVDVFLEPEKYLSLATSHALRSIFDRLLVVVQASAKKIQETFGAEVVRNPRYREALIEMFVVLNAALAAYTLQQEMGNRGIGTLKLKPPTASIFWRRARSGPPVAAPRYGPDSPIRLAISRLLLAMETTSFTRIGLPRYSD